MSTKWVKSNKMFLFGDTSHQTGTSRHGRHVPNFRPLVSLLTFRDIKIQATRWTENPMQTITPNKWKKWPVSRNQSLTLANHFIQNFTKEDKSHKLNKGPSPYGSMEHIQFQVKGVEKLLQNLKPHKATCRASIPYFILKVSSPWTGPHPDYTKHL